MSSDGAYPSEWGDQPMAHPHWAEENPLRKCRQYILSIAPANRRFAPSVVGTVLAIVGVSIFVSLGMWQLRRAEQKEALQVAFERGQESTVTMRSENIGSLERYQHIRARGRYQTERQILLDNMPSALGRPGYRVLTPFELEDGAFVLVDRGWIPMGDRRTDLPQLGVDETAREISGRLDVLPRPGLRLEESAQDTKQSWPRVMNFPQLETIERALGVQVAPYIVLLDATEPHGFERQWQGATRFGPERHVGYAVQWFAFALVAIVIYVSLSLRPRKQADAMDSSAS